MGNALLLSGGAPNMAFMAGGLSALDEKGVKFDAISTSGAGMLIGLLYAAPRGSGTPQQLRQAALRSTLDMYVDDRIYKMMSRVWRFPANYKAFYKSGRAAQLYTRMTQYIPRMKFASESRTRFANDWMDLMLTMGCPTTLGLWSKGTCQPAPFIDKMVDFAKLKDFPSDFYMNAYCLESRDIEIFTKQQINAEHFQAALSMPFLYAPYKLNGKTYIEGSAVDTICFEPVMKDLYEPVPDCDWTPSPSGKRVPVAYRPKHDKPKIDSLILFNMLGHDNLLREPDNLLDALGMQIITPLVPMTQDDIRIFKNEYLPRYQVGNPKLRLLSVDVRATEEEWQHMLDWSYSNGERLFKMGYDAALNFFEQHKDRLLAA